MSEENVILKVRTSPVSERPLSMLMEGELQAPVDNTGTYINHPNTGIQRLYTEKDFQNFLAANPEFLPAMTQFQEYLEDESVAAGILADINALEIQEDDLQGQITVLDEEKLDIDGDSKDNTVTFTEAVTDADIVSGETHSTFFGKIKKRFSVINIIITAFRAMFCAEYTNTVAYAIGDYVRKDDVLKRCTSSTTIGEAWSDAKWTTVTVMSEIRTINNNLTVVPGTITSTPFNSVNYYHYKSNGKAYIRFYGITNTTISGGTTAISGLFIPSASVTQLVFSMDSGGNMLATLLTLNTSGNISFSATIGSTRYLSFDFEYDI